MIKKSFIMVLKALKKNVLCIVYLFCYHLINIKCFFKVKFLFVGSFLSVRFQHKSPELNRNENPTHRTFVFSILHKYFFKFISVESDTKKKSNI